MAVVRNYIYVYDSHVSVPTKSIPQSQTYVIGPKGLKQIRYYGNDGSVTMDIDFYHSGVKHKFPHIHIWNRKRSGAINHFNYINY